MTGRIEPPRRVIWITTDHLRYDNIAAYGNAAMRTPVLDALAANAMNFHQCYVQNPVCMASRASFMTGLYPQQTGITVNGQTLPPDFEPTVAGAFKAAGYRTVQIGKLHFQPHENLDYDPRPRHTYGFDLFWSSEERGNYADAWYNWLTGKYPQYASAFRCPRSTSVERAESERRVNVIDAPWQASHSGWIVETATDYLRWRKSGRHFLHLGFFNPHPPLSPTREAWSVYENAEIVPPEPAGEEWTDKPEPLAGMLKARRDWTREDFENYLRAFRALVTEVDLALGALVDFLKREKMFEDTLLVFSSDHGDYCGEHGITHKNAAFYDGVMRVPLMLHWPRGLGEGRRDANGLMEMVDLLPTLLGLAGAWVPEVMAGRNLAGDLLAGREPPGREDVYAYSGAGWAMLRSERYKYLRYDSTGGEVLYDLSETPVEVVNHAGNVQYREALEEMRLRMLSRTLAASASRLPRTYQH